MRSAEDDELAARTSLAAARALLEERQAEGLQISPKTVPLLVRAVRCLASTYADDSYVVSAEDPAAGGSAETLAKGSNHLVMKAAYEAACDQRPGCIVTLRQKARIIYSSDRDRQVRTTA